MTLTFDPLTLTMCGRSGIMHSTYVPNLNEIDQSAAKLLMINVRFFVRFRGCSNLSIDDLKTRIAICTKCGEDIDRSLPHTKFKDGEDSLLGFQTTATQIRALLSNNAKNRTF